VKYQYHSTVHVVTRKHLSEAAKQYPDAAKEIGAWVGIVEAVKQLREDLRALSLDWEALNRAPSENDSDYEIPEPEEDRR
jgi:hypothetical protein